MMGRKLRYTGRKSKPFTLATARGPLEVTPDEIMDIHPLTAIELLRGGEFAPAPASEYKGKD